MSSKQKADSRSQYAKNHFSFVIFHFTLDILRSGLTSLVWKTVHAGFKFEVQPSVWKTSAAW